jgi:hypothetical protein
VTSPAVWSRTTPGRTACVAITMSDNSDQHLDGYRTELMTAVQL